MLEKQANGGTITISFADEYVRVLELVHTDVMGSMKS